MEQKWWSVSISCAVHKKEIPITGAVFSGDGEIAFFAFCAECKETYRWITTGQKLVHLGLLNDFQAWIKGSKKPKESKPVQPPLAIPPPILTEDDKKFFRDDGIIPPEDLQ